MAEYDYDAYGAVREQSGQRSNSFKYVAQIGHPTDEETGLIYMRVRYYDPEVGRFVSEDPGRNGGNWYCYVSENPVNKLDADGNLEWSITGLGIGFSAMLLLMYIDWLRFGHLDTDRWYKYLAAFVGGFVGGSVLALFETNVLISAIGEEIYAFLGIKGVTKFIFLAASYTAAATVSGVLGWIAGLSIYYSGWWVDGILGEKDPLPDNLLQPY